MRFTTDGTHAHKRREGENSEQSILARLVEERRLLGSPVEEGVSCVPSLPLGGMSVEDQVLSATLAHLPISGDLASYGWRIGPGAGGAWHSNRAFHDRLVEGARIAYLDYEGPLHLARFGPALLSRATFTAAGERVLADRGLVRELPGVLAEAHASERAAVASRIPGAQVRILVDERGARAVLHGRVRTVSGYRFYPPLGSAGMSDVWGRFINESPAEDALFLLDSDASVLQAARDAGVRACAMDPLSGDLREPGPLWESLAAAGESGVGLAWLFRHDQLEAAARHVHHMWQRLGYSGSDARSFTYVLTRGPLREPALPAAANNCVTTADIDGFVRVASRIAEEVMA